MGKNRTTVYLSDEAEDALEKLRENAPGGFNLSENVSEWLNQELEKLEQKHPEIDFE